ncbi:hypothetical protein D477_014191 [Arthrobacter crystallopoietes BAB-32]|uniref:Uncharacterized protein n=1 Tax=Arthrobacter crystallopoietes BAB-32 TaxID=1246476 RepID=N1V5L8_9MICC|nr:hypothetical protein [Arthrobacter crystallopoietes]EMY33558.1 hypothetical protein D477_014191 [Arthrobacter crystallopoietes BAB-32]
MTTQTTTNRTARKTDSELDDLRMQAKASLRLSGDMHLRAWDVLVLVDEIITRRKRENADQRTAGYIVVEYNQASGQPGLEDFGDIHRNRDDAEDRRDWLVEQNAKSGRRERYRIGTVEVEEDDD